MITYTAPDTKKQLPTTTETIDISHLSDNHKKRARKFVSMLAQNSADVF